MNVPQEKGTSLLKITSSASTRQRWGQWWGLWVDAGLSAPSSVQQAPESPLLLAPALPRGIPLPPPEGGKPGSQCNLCVRTLSVACFLLMKWLLC